MAFTIHRPSSKLTRAVVLPNAYNPCMASARIAKWIADELGIELWDDPKKIVYKPIDELYFVYGMVAFCKFREEIGKLAPFVKKYIFCENDYLGCHLTQLRAPLRDKYGVDPIILTTVPDKLKNARGFYIN